MWIAAISCVLLWGIVLICVRKDLSLAVILLLNTYFLGLLDPNMFGSLNMFDINALACIIYIFIIAKHMSVRELKNSIFIKYICILLAFFCYGVLAPWLRGDSTLFYALKEGKHYIHYLAFFAVYLTVDNLRSVRLAWKLIFLVAGYYVCIDLLFNISRGRLGLIHYLFRPDPALGIIVVYLPIMLIIFLALFHAVWNISSGSMKAYFISIVFFVGAILTTFRAYILGGFAAISITAFRARGWTGLLKMTCVCATTLFILLFVASLTTSGSILKRFNNIFYQNIGSGIVELLYHKGGSLEGRDAVNKLRWRYFWKRPMGGYGFIDKYSSLGRKIFIKKGIELTMIDAGYLDVLIKFGLIGALVFYGTLALIIIKVDRLAKAALNSTKAISFLAVESFIMMLFIAQYTHSSLTYSFGIVPLSIALALVDREYSLLQGEVQ